MTTTFQHCSAALLCGGQSQRMGFDKALFLKDRAGRSLLASLAGELTGHFGEVILVTNDRQKLAVAPDLAVFKLVEDLQPGLGPAGAILTALNVLPDRPVFVLACDMPVIDWRILTQLLSLMEENQADAALPRHGDHLEPLHAFYGHRCAPILSDSLTAGRLAIRESFPFLKTVFLDLDPTQTAPGLFKNLNTPDEARQAGFTKSVGEPREHILRTIPKVDQLLLLAGRQPELALTPLVLLRSAIRETLELLRHDLRTGIADSLPNQKSLMDRIIRTALNRKAFGLRPVINATGVILHTNLGRAVLAKVAAKQVAAVAQNYSTLEYNPATGNRGHRGAQVKELLISLTGGEEALVVNNNAAAIFLALTALGRGREIIVSRGELVEIGGSFRIPEIMEQGGVILKEVGTTNKTRLTDYIRAIDPERTAGLLKVHTSNFRILGYTESTPVAELATLTSNKNLPLICDLGSGTLVNLRPLGVKGETTVQEILATGADLVTFSGDKLLGGTQAGLIVGRSRLVKQLAAHPLARALRPGKLTLAALEATLRIYLDPSEITKQIPTLAMLSARSEELKIKAKNLLKVLGEIPGLTLRISPTKGQVGGGAAPEHPLNSWAITIDLATPPPISLNKLEERLRQDQVPVIGRIQHNHLLLDVRTIQTEEFETIARALRRAIATFSGQGGTRLS